MAIVNGSAADRPDSRFDTPDEDRARRRRRAALLAAIVALLLLLGSLVWWNGSRDGATASADPQVAAVTDVGGPSAVEPAGDDDGPAGDDGAPGAGAPDADDQARESGGDQEGDSGKKGAKKQKAEPGAPAGTGGSGGGGGDDGPGPDGGPGTDSGPDAGTDPDADGNLVDVDVDLGLGADGPGGAVTSVVVTACAKTGGLLSTKLDVTATVTWANGYVGTGVAVKGLSLGSLLDPGLLTVKLDGESFTVPLGAKVKVGVCLDL